MDTYKLRVQWASERLPVDFDDWLVGYFSEREARLLSLLVRCKPVVASHKLLYQDVNEALTAAE